MKCRILVFSVMSCYFLFLFSNENKKKYNYVIETEKRIFIKDSLYLNADAEFSTEVTYISKNLFIESNFFKTEMIYLIRGNKIYLLSKSGKWKLFFSERIFNSRRKIFYDDFVLVPKEKILVSSKVEYVYYLFHKSKLDKFIDFYKNNKKISNVDNNQFIEIYYIPKEGFVRIDYLDFKLIRI